MKLKCECGEIVGKGDIETINVKGKGVKKLYLDGKLKGTIIKNKSNDPNEWKFTCSNCQK